AVCSRNRGITLPALPNTLPKRTNTNCVVPFFKLSQNTPARRLDAPITLVGLTALSGETRTNFSHFAVAAARATTHIPCAQFRTDRTAGAGDENHPAAQPLAQPGAVEHDGVAAEKIVELDMTYGRQLRAPADQIFVRRDGKRLESGSRAKLRYSAAHAVRCRRQRDDHGAHAVTPDPQRQFRDGSQHAHVAQEAPLFRGVVVEETDDPPLSAVRELLGQQRA